MKRNSIFMWAYITFILLAIIMRLFFDYPLWAPLVVAVTLSSVSFSIEDLFASLARTLSDTCDNKEKYVPIAREKAEKALTFYEKASKHINRFESMGHDISVTKKSLESIKAHLTEIMQVFSDIEQEAVHDRDVQKRYLKYADCLAYLGFLSLFCALIFTPLITIPSATQDEITVFSFFIILITRQIHIDKSLKIKDDMLKYQDTIQKQEELETDISSVEKNFNSLSELMDITVHRPEEVSNHAD